MSETCHHPVQIYYEDTDHSGFVYHANYLKYFERAREHYLGIEGLVQLGNEGTGFVVFKAELTFREGAHFGDSLVIRTRAVIESEYRLRFLQDVLRQGGDKVMVAGVVELVCIDRSRKLVPLPASVLARVGGGP